MPVYADASDLFTWLDGIGLPDNAPQYLRACSLQVQSETKTAFYQVDGYGLPTNPVFLAGFRDATCAQAQAWIAAGLDPSGVFLGGDVEQSVGVGSARVTYGDDQAAIAQKQALLMGLCPQARLIIESTGIQLNKPWMVG